MLLARDADSYNAVIEGRQGKGGGKGGREGEGGRVCVREGKVKVDWGEGLSTGKVRAGAVRWKVVAGVSAPVFALKIWVSGSSAAARSARDPLPDPMCCPFAPFTPAWPESSPWFS